SVHWHSSYQNPSCCIISPRPQVISREVRKAVRSPPQARTRLGLSRKPGREHRCNIVNIAPGVLGKKEIGKEDSALAQK
uniref:Uncharacterized protein n=1 Tax=Sus scrofa TaxID=9823 RepID=A0A8D1N1A8_PIG